MTDPIPLKPKKPTASDALDIDDLWLDTSLGDGITDTRQTTIPIGKPKDFFRVCPLPGYRRRTELYVHKVEGQIEEKSYIVAPPMRGKITEARNVTLVVCIYRDESLRVWALKHPNANEKDNEAWKSARRVARIAMDKWVKLLWLRKSYLHREAPPGYAPDPDYSKLPPFDEIIRVAFGEHGIIRDETHPIYRELFGLPANRADGDGDDL